MVKYNNPLNKNVCKNIVSTCPPYLIFNIVTKEFLGIRLMYQRGYYSFGKSGVNRLFLDGDFYGYIYIYMNNLAN